MPPQVNLTTDYAGFAKEGDWVEMHVDIQPHLEFSLRLLNLELPSQ